MKVKITILLGLISVNFSSNTVPKENENIEGEYRYVQLYIHIISQRIYVNILRTQFFFVEGYYWREYRGFIPEDAFPGGRDRDNRTTYIAQVLSDKLLIPGEIHDSEKRAYYEWGFREHVATENIKVIYT